MMPVLARDVAQKSTRAHPSLQSEEFENVKCLQTGVAMVHSLLLMSAKSGIIMFPANHPLFLFVLNKLEPFWFRILSHTLLLCVCHGFYYDLAQ